MVARAARPKKRVTPRRLTRENERLQMRASEVLAKAHVGTRVWVRTLQGDEEVLTHAEVVARDDPALVTLKSVATGTQFKAGIYALAHL